MHSTYHSKFYFPGWIWRCCTHNGFWKNLGMFLCNIWRAGHCSPDTNNREQLQQVLCQTEEVGECCHPGPQQEVPEPVCSTQGQRGRDFIRARVVACSLEDFNLQCRITCNLTRTWWSLDVIANWRHIITRFIDTKKWYFSQSYWRYTTQWRIRNLPGPEWKLSMWFRWELPGSNKDTDNNVTFTRNWDWGRLERDREMWETEKI